MLTLSQGNHQLGQPGIVDEEPGGDDGESGILALGGKFAELLLGEQQFAVAAGVVVVVGAVEILGYVHAFYPELTVYECAVAVGQAGFAFTDGFYLCSGEHNAGCPGIKQLVVKRGALVLYVYVLGCSALGHELSEIKRYSNLGRYLG